MFDNVSITKEYVPQLVVMLPSGATTSIHFLIDVMEGLQANDGRLPYVQSTIAKDLEKLEVVRISREYDGVCLCTEAKNSYAFYQYLMDKWRELDYDD